MDKGPVKHRLGEAKPTDILTKTGGLALSAKHPTWKYNLIHYGWVSGVWWCRSFIKGLASQIARIPERGLYQDNGWMRRAIRHWQALWSHFRINTHPCIHLLPQWVARMRKCKAPQQLTGVTQHCTTMRGASRGDGGRLLQSVAEAEHASWRVRGWGQEWWELPSLTPVPPLISLSWTMGERLCMPES